MEAIINWIQVHPMLVFLSLSYFAMCYWCCKFKKRLKFHWVELFLLPLVHLILGYLSAQFMALVEVGFAVKKAATLRLFGAVFLMPVMYYVWAKLTKRDSALTLDFASVCVILGLMGGRLNCFLTGCCAGRLMGNIRMPLREMEMVFYVLFIAFYAIRIVKGKTHGQVYPLYMILYGILRFAMEFFREEYTTNVGVLHLAHVWAIVSVVAGSIWLLKVNKIIFNRKKPEKTR